MRREVDGGTRRWSRPGGPPPRHRSVAGQRQDRRCHCVGCTSRSWSPPARHRVDHGPVTPSLMLMTHSAGPGGRPAPCRGSGADADDAKPTRRRRQHAPTLALGLGRPHPVVDALGQGYSRQASATGHSAQMRWAPARRRRHSERRWTATGLALPTSIQSVSMDPPRSSGSSGAPDGLLPVRRYVRCPTSVRARPPEGAKSGVSGIPHRILMCDLGFL